MKAGCHEDLEESAGMLHRAFRIFSDGNDFIELKSMSKVLRRMGHHYSNAEIQNMIKAEDAHKSGKVSFEDFVHFMAPKIKPDHNGDELREAFKAIDVSGKGSINADDLLLTLWGIGQRVNEEELNNAIKRADKD